MLGKSGETLDCRHVMPLARTFGDLISPDGEGTFAIGYDVRATSPSLAEAVSLGLRSGGHHVIHIGPCTTPQLEWYIDHAGLHGGVMLAGGDAPAHWNGLHLYGANAAPIPAEQAIDAFIEHDLNCLLHQPCSPALRHESPLQAYAAFLRQRLRPNNFFKLCLDVGNGLAGREVEAVIAHYRQLRVWPIAFTPDPTFPVRGPDPFAPAAIKGLAHCVCENGCQLGAAIDADGDELAVVDESGRLLAPDAVGALLALALAPHHETRRVLHDAAVRPHILQALARANIETQRLDGGPTAAHAPLHATPPEAFLYFDAAGHYAFAETPGTANGLLALIELINHLTDCSKPISALVDFDSSEPVDKSRSAYACV